MRFMDVGRVVTFDECPDCKQTAVKVLEEAAEVVEAWKGGDDGRLADELADVVQAACNLAAARGIDLRIALDCCETRNMARGRITPGVYDPLGTGFGREPTFALAC